MFLVVTLLCIIVLSTSVTCYAVCVLDYGEVIEKALRHAHDVRISELDVRISKAEYRKALSVYWPTVSARWNSEYAKDLTDGTAQLDVIGNTILVQNTVYQSSFSLIGNYNLYDFGATTERVSIAAKDVDVKKSAYRQSLRDIELKVLNIYSELLINYEEIEAKKELLGLYKELSSPKNGFTGPVLYQRSMWLTKRSEP